MTRSKSSERVVIALTEACPVADLWSAALNALQGSTAELYAIFLHDERWQRAASLPFTREVPASGGAATDFTATRAAEVLQSTATSLRKSIEDLATEAGLAVAFEVLPETDQTSVMTLVTSKSSIVVGPSVLASHPIFVELQRANLQVVLIEQGDQESG